MIGTPAASLGKLIGPVLQGLVLAPEDEVNADVFEAPGGEVEGGPGAVDRVGAAKPAQVHITQGLNPDRKSIDAHGTEFPEPLRFGRSGVGLERDFRLSVESPKGLDGADDLADDACPHQARRSAAEIDGRAPVICRLPEVADEHVAIGTAPHPHVDIGSDTGIEVAVGAQGSAVWPMDVEAECPVVRCVNPQGRRP